LDRKTILYNKFISFLQYNNLEKWAYKPVKSTESGWQLPVQQLEQAFYQVVKEPRWTSPKYPKIGENMKFKMQK
jgi:hypothetical protein